MNKKEIPISIKSGSDEVEFSKMHGLFSLTEYGNKLAGDVRYDRYRPSNITNEKWQHILGVDVNNLKHLRLTYGLTRQFINYSEKMELTNKEQENLLLSAIVHDWAEAVVGDKSYDLKTTTEEDMEFKELKKMTNNMFGSNNKELLQRIHYVIDTIIKDQNTKLGKIFNAIERVGYLRTGLRAWQESKNTSGELKTNLEWLTNNVFLNQISKLIEYATAYPAVALYLKGQKELINDAFSNLSDVFFKYGLEGMEEKRKQFKLTQQKWQEYCQNFIK